MLILYTSRAESARVLLKKDAENAKMRAKTEGSYPKLERGVKRLKWRATFGIKTVIGATPQGAWGKSDNKIAPREGARRKSESVTA